jgi:hypothetical protein
MKDLKEATSQKTRRLDSKSISDALSILSETKETRVSGSIRLHDYSLLHFEEYNVSELKEILEQLNNLKTRETNGHKETI